MLVIAGFRVIYWQEGGKEEGRRKREGGGTREGGRGEVKMRENDAIITG